MRARELSLYTELATYVGMVRLEVESIATERQAELERLAAAARRRRRDGEPARLVFICTHNSRRSHLAQVWAQTAAWLAGVSGVEAYSGGTEATAFDPRAVAALARAGFHVAAAADGPNPAYTVRFSDQVEAMVCFSKVYDQAPNPSGGFCAVMTCSAADEACPVVRGASERIAIPYDDPKEADGTARERAVYDERCRQIAREMLYALSLVAP